MGQAGRNGGGGPPDLDEIWRNFNRRLAELFGRRQRGEPTAAATVRAARGLPIGRPGLLVALVILVWLASGFYIVDEGRRGVVTRFGKYTETTQPGPRWHLPYPDRGGRGRRLLAGADRRGRLSQHAQEQDRQGSGDADR